MRAHTKGKDKMGKQFAIVIGVAAAGVMALGAQTAAGLPSQTVKIDSKVTLAVSDPPGRGCCRVHGRVESSKHACEVNRTVKFFARRREVPDRLVREDKTNDNGRWSFLLAARPGVFYAKVVRREVDTGGTTFVCRHDRTAAQDWH